MKPIDKSPALKKWVVMGFIHGFPISKANRSFDCMNRSREADLYDDINVILSERRSDVFYDMVEDIVKKWNDHENETFKAKLVWCCGRDWFTTRQ